MTPPKFLADEMNGDIARWLRIIGFDCLYFTGDNLDNKLLEIAESENRILLTSDRELYQRAIRRYIGAVYTSGENTEIKLRKIFNILNLNTYVNSLKYRCPVCNTVLVQRESRELDLPAHIKNNHKTVYVCEKCGKVYWKGSHWAKIRDTFRRLGVDI